MILPSSVKSKLLVVWGVLVSTLGVLAQSSTFTYQGQLSSNGVAATGLFDARFTLYDAATVGNQIGSPVTVGTLGVTNGLFTTELTYGAAAFDGNSRWLEIGVRPSGSPSNYTTLAPRQALTATPYAVRAISVSGGLATTNLTGKINDTNLSANVALLTNNATFTRSVTASNFIGSGLSVTNIPATNLIGTLPDARLSPNVAFLNTSNTAFLGSVSATNFYGEGRGLTNVPGRIFEFVPTAGSINPSYANYGYVATSDSTPVVITLPVNGQLTNGNVIRVSGIGAAGWIIAQNTNQTILVANLLNNVGVGWTTNGTAFNWKAIASSVDGRRMVAVVNNGFIYTSTNYGATWGQQANSQSRAWTSVASSADGLRLVACVNAGQIYTSVNAGTNWAPQGIARNWTGIASSLDGNRIVAAAASSGIYVSTDGGTNWPGSPNLSGAVSWTGVASSGNGSNIMATALSQQIYISNNGGAAGSWTNRETARLWTCIATSTDGSVVTAGVGTSGFIYTSTDFGATWVPNTTALNWAGIACSADGGRMIAVANSGGVYVSQDMGANWQIRSTLPTGLTYTGAACSGDGTTLAAVANASGIFVSSKTSTTPGTAGQLIGARLAAVELQYVGNGVFIPLSYVGNIRVK
jgi:hypothetical protein